jgi:transformation/transcription domain-associated protein
MERPSHVWRLRQQFSFHYALNQLFGYTFYLSPKHLTKWCMNMKNGQFFITEITPSYHSQTLQLESLEPLPFRLTPNLQYFITPQQLQSHFSLTLLNVSRILTEKGADIETMLNLCMRNDLFYMTQYLQKPWISSSSTSTPPSNVHHVQQDKIYREKAMMNSNLILKRIQLLSCKSSEEIKKQDVDSLSETNSSSETSSSIPIDALLYQLIASSTNPHLMAQTDLTGYPWF